MAKLISSGLIDGRVQNYWLHPGDDGNDNITVETVQDVEPILERNKRAYNDAPTRFGPGDFHKVADIPVTVIEDIARVRKIPFPELMQGRTDRAQAIWDDLVNGRDFRLFRTRPGVVDMRKR